MDRLVAELSRNFLPRRLLELAAQHVAAFFFVFVVFAGFVDAEFGLDGVLGSVRRGVDGWGERWGEGGVTGWRGRWGG